jgi:hypothetical protein
MMPAAAVSFKTDLKELLVPREQMHETVFSFPAPFS